MHQSIEKRKLSIAIKWGLTGLIVLGTLLRIWGLSFGLPYLYDPDEPNKIIMAQRIFKTGDLNPRYFKKPSLFIYLNALLYVPCYGIGKGLGVFAQPSDIPYPETLAMGVGKIAMPELVLMGRGLTVAFSVTSLLLLFISTWHLTDDAYIGLLAVLFMAISPTHVWLAHRIRSDTFLVFFSLLCFWASVIILNKGTTFSYVMAGTAGGLAASSKYNGALVLLCPLVAHLLRKGWSGVRDHRVFWIAVPSVLAFCMTTPFAVITPKTFTNGIIGEFQHYARGHSGMEGNSALWYLSYLWTQEGPSFLLAGVAIFYGILRRQKELLLASIFPIVYFPFISAFAVRNDRTLVPLLPFFFILAAFILARSFSEMAKRTEVWGNVWRGLLLFFLLILVGIPLRKSLMFDRQLTIPDSRKTAIPWIDKHLPKGARIGIEAYSPYVNPSHYEVLDIGRMINHEPQWYVEQEVDYLIFAEDMFGRYFREPERYTTEVAQYKMLFQTFELLKSFSDGNYEVRIYLVN